MAQIGAFTLKDGAWTGTIRTMTINVKAQLVPNKEKERTRIHQTSGFTLAAQSSAQPGVRTRRMVKLHTSL